MRIIMDATGFNRDEIQPDMDLRRDLSIRSSRLPIIMEAAERQFGITIELEDFIGVRTVKDIVQRISKVIAKQGGPGLQPATKAVDPDAAEDEILESPEDGARLKRLVFDQATVEPAASIPIELSPGESVLLLSPDGDDGIAGRAGDILRLDYGVDAVPMLFRQGDFDPGVEGHDLRTDEGASRAVERMADLSPLSGMVIHLSQGGSEKSGNLADVSRLLRGLFLLVKAFLQSPAKKFVVLIHSREEYRNSRSAAGGRDARTFSERSAGIPIGPVSHIGNRQGYRPCAMRCALLWTEDAPWWRSFIVMEGSSLRRGAWPRRSSGILRV